ncbi:hypothetical protein [Sodalinema gerasimenkoae]|uniref:hypothetical protein n=1 Tax=Sodalinema gerasimenkoae TaxID=2862348 RepID=UPI001CA57378|nr:hypothetical protein [Sodalinema gerasimenkoae]
MNPHRWYFIGAVITVGIVGLSLLLMSLPGLPEFPVGLPRTCITGGWKLGLIISHVLNFALIPLAMNAFYEGLAVLEVPRKTIFFGQVGFGLIMVGIASEIGLHVAQCWYYESDYSVLNFLFYFFLVSGFILWAESLVKHPTQIGRGLRIFFAISLVFISVFYLLGYQTGEDRLKIPIFIILTVIFSVLTYRGYRLLRDKRVFWVPFFSVGVNLLFVALLNQYGGDPYENPQVMWNALFHIGHDVFGTEAGLAIFALLMYPKGLEMRRDC